MNLDNKKVSYVTFGLLLLFLLSIAICGFAYCKDASEMADLLKLVRESGNMSSSEYLALDEAYHRLILAICIQIIPSIIGVGFAGYGIYVTHEVFDIGPEEILRSLAPIGILIGVIFAGLGLNTIAMIPKEMRDIIPGELIALIVFAFIAIIASIGSYFIDVTLYLNVRKCILAFVGVSILISASLNLSIIAKSGSAADIATNVFFLLSGLVIGILALLIKEEFRRPVRRTADPIYNTSSQSTGSYSTTNSMAKPASTQAPKVNAEEELRKLKKLLDDGIINQEEYYDKRKKYVDML